MVLDLPNVTGKGIFKDSPEDNQVFKNQGQKDIPANDDDTIPTKTNSLAAATGQSINIATSGVTYTTIFESAANLSAGTYLITGGYRADLLHAEGTGPHNLWIKVALYKAAAVIAGTVKQHTVFVANGSSEYTSGQTSIIVAVNGSEKISLKALSGGTDIETCTGTDYSLNWTLLE